MISAMLYDQDFHSLHTVHVDVHARVYYCKYMQEDVKDIGKEIKS
jgi:hypothetical protein